MQDDPRERVTVTLDASLLRRIDRVAEARGEARSAVVERMVANEIGEEERFMRLMENPATRLIFQTLMSNPRIVESIAVLVGDKLDPEDAERMAKVIREQTKRGRERRGKKHGGTGKVAISEG